MMRGKNNSVKFTLERMTHDKEGLEIGVWAGRSTVRFAQISKSVDAVDPWSLKPYREGCEYPEWQAFLDKYEPEVGSNHPLDYESYYEHVYNVVKRKAEKWGNINIYRMTSKEFFAQNEKTYDWAYVDGDHSYRGCRFDLRSTWSIIRPGGVMFGDDYGDSKPGVTQAVNEFAGEFGVNVVTYGVNQFMVEKK